MKIGVLQGGESVSVKFSHRRGRRPPIILARIDRPYNFVVHSFHTNKLCSRLSSSNNDFTWKTPFCVFELPHPLRGNVRSSS